MSDHELLRTRACVEELLERGAHLQLDSGHGHPRGVPAAQDEDDERADEDEPAEERADAHGGREDLAHLSEDARRRVELPVEDIKALHERNRHEYHRQNKGQLDPAEDVEFEEIARIDERPREIARTDEGECTRDAEEHPACDDDAPRGRVLRKASFAKEIEQPRDGECRKEVCARECREHADLAPRAEQDGHHADEREHDEGEEYRAAAMVQRRNDE